MIKRGFTIGLLFLLVFVSGCTFDAVDLFLNNGQIANFLEQYPNADISVVHFNPGESDADKFNEICEKTLNLEKELYRAKINDIESGLEVIAFLDASSQQMECVRKYGSGEAPEVTGGREISDPNRASARTLPPKTEEPTTTHTSPQPPEAIEAPVEGVIRNSETSQPVRPTQPIEETTCIEPDDGEIFASGRSTYTINGEEFYEDDLCEGDTLKESHCLSSSAVPINEDVECEFGCSEGACRIDAPEVDPTADTDGDGLVDQLDSCPNGYPGWDSSDSSLDFDGDGCLDAGPDEDLDEDNDGTLDEDDPCPKDASDSCPEFGETDNPAPELPEEDPVAEEPEETTTFTKENPESCTDSDGGSNGLEKGTTKIFYTGGSTTYTDSCAGQSVKEHVCNGNMHETTTIYCGRFCVDGACINN